MTRRPRHLSEDEKRLWDQVRRQAKPLRPAGPKPAAPAPPEVSPPEIPAAPPEGETRIPDFRIGEAHKNGRPAHDLALGVGAELRAQPIRMDRKTHTRLTRGKLTPEARLDLHGMTLDRAHPTLTRFILDSHAQGRRLVLVITGKGRGGADDGPIPMRRGVLRHQVPQWLRGPGLAHAVLQVTEAHRRHGGEGAYYVYLRRGR